MCAIVSDLEGETERSKATTGMRDMSYALTVWYLRGNMQNVCYRKQT